MLTRYSPVRRSPNPEGSGAHDLHALCTPPAFVLSQDQTLHCSHPSVTEPAVSSLTVLAHDPIRSTIKPRKQHDHSCALQSLPARLLLPISPCKCAPLPKNHSPGNAPYTNPSQLHLSRPTPDPPSTSNPIGFCRSHRLGSEPLLCYNCGRHKEEFSH